MCDLETIAMFGRRILAVALLALACGCSDPGPQMYSISGTATSNGKPLPNLYINFSPDDKSKYADSAAMTDAEGRFTMRVGSREGVFPGPHTVIVADPAGLQGGSSSSDPDYQAAIKKYGRNSPLRVTIDKDDDEFELKLD
jgi:hypothetical protein